ncbi:hypothetical protein ACROYT_G017944 [Oculina patagonica]
MHNAYPAPTHDIHCTRPDCVLPSCVNQKLQKMKNNNPNKTKKPGRKPRCVNLKLQKRKTANTSKAKKPGRKPKVSMDQNKKMNVVGAGESTSRAWEDELEDILSILGVHNNDTAHQSSYATDNDVFAPDASDQQCPQVLQSVFGEELHLFEDSQTPSILPFCQSDHANPLVHLIEVPNTSRPEISVQSNCPIFPVTQHMEIDLTDSGGIAKSAFNANVAHNIDQSTGIANALELPYLMNRAVFRREGSPLENSLGLKRSPKQRKHQVRYPDREETGSTSDIKRKPRNPIQSPNKLFGILSLILQAFNDPLTAELEECYTGVLQRALAEIQSAVSIDNM